MKQPKPMVGQTWEHKDCGVEFILDETAIDNWVQIAYYSIFVPQNDLEWLAVNETEWFHGDCDFIRRNSSDKPMYTSNPNNAMNVRHDYATRPQWQNMRYRLGLDTKPHYKLINGQWSKTK